ncbi:SET and MYND domain-containing protein 4-like [Neodiprion fabricii]|uniref:SET and MYND domain-containing protein 4-like n=1 Tax=Neodiprion fabricii TaxID=2872261 RepID=UPI001ED8E366|nr:SET and MYND domain-containing protein 4-like [Neodiprion fabricii]
MPKISAPNVKIPCASDAIAVEHSAKLVQHLIATRKIKSGEILILEKPHCSILNQRSIYTYCSHCLQISWTLIPCKYCVYAAYYSELRRDKAWNEYHEIECSIMGFLLCFSVPEQYWLGVRLTIMISQKGMKLATLKEELAHVDRFKGPHTKENINDGKFCNDQYRNIYTLPNNVGSSFVLKQLVSVLWCALSICMIGRETEMFGKKMEVNYTFTKNPHVIFVGELMLRNVDISLMKATVFGASCCSASYDHGLTLLALCRLANHSCDPNTIEQWYTEHLALYAAYPIENGEQIFRSYVPRYIVMDKSKRRGRLQDRNLMCECIPCKEIGPRSSLIVATSKKQLLKRPKLKLMPFCNNTL